MYRKEIIYMGLYKDGSKIGNAGFLKVENREEECSLDLKLKNIPFNVRGRFPIRVYNGNGWREINGISVQEGGGSWKETTADNAYQIEIQIMLPGGYSLEGKSKEAPGAAVRTKMDSDRAELLPEREEMRSSAAVEKVHDTRSDARGNMPQDIQNNRQNMQLITRKETSENMHEAVSAEMSDRAGKDSFSDKQGDMRIRANSVMSEDREVEKLSDRQEDRVTGKTSNIQDDMAVETSLKVQDEPERETLSERQNEIIAESIDIGKNNSESDKKSYTQTKARTNTGSIMITQDTRSSGTNVQARRDDPSAEYQTAYGLKEDKWEQILDSYEKIHPYGDERVYVKLEPKDFIILQAQYQHLVNNSFLLHGFYNYRYIILGKENDYYLGVPGVFYEREKMVALMFGFEAFECPGGIARAGEFGYYLRKVEL